MEQWDAQQKGLSCEKIQVGYGKKILLSDVELSVEPGHILTLIGPNGSGKSTILKTITRQLPMMGGIIYLGKRDMLSMSGEEIARSMSIVMTERVTPELMTCREVAAIGRYPFVGRMGILSGEDWRKVDEAMELVNASEVADKNFLEISDGQRQRVMLARAICQEPQILVLDEPTSYLDMRYKLDILKIIRKMAVEKKIAVIMSLHELELAQKVSDVIACVDGETVSFVGTPEEVFAGDRIRKLYQLRADDFDPFTGALLLSGKKEKPEIFVIGGGGAGLPIYHRLMREGISFAAGILMENDLEGAAAQAGAAEVIFSKAFYPASQEQIREAKKLIDECRECICAVKEFGPYNEWNRELLLYAEQTGKAVKMPD